MKPENFEVMISKKITGVVVKASEANEPPRSQVFLLFSDGTYSELYSDGEIKAAKQWPGGPDEVRNYMTPPKRLVFEVYQQPI